MVVTNLDIIAPGIRTLPRTGVAASETEVAAVTHRTDPTSRVARRPNLTRVAAAGRRHRPSTHANMIRRDGRQIVTRRGAAPRQCTIAEAAPHHELTLVHSVPPNVPLALA